GAEAARGKKTVGYTYQVDMEALLREEPDLVIGLPGLHSRLQQPLQENHIPFLLLSLSNFEQIKRAVTILADVSGRRAEGQALIAGMERDMAETAAALPKEAARFVVIHGTAQSVTIECDGTLACEAAARLGLKNAFGDLQAPEGGSHLPFSMEQLVEKDPDILFLTTMVAPGKEQDAFKDHLMAHPAWAALKAVREGRVYFLPQKYFLMSPGVEYPKAVRFMAEQLYPDRGRKEET
ncbi:MAG: ABC transporter substrate-binding protein, partial [Schwartzia sp. (in: firmicutes)]